MKAFIKFLPRIIRFTIGLVSDKRFRDFVGLIVDKSGSKFPVEDRFQAAKDQLEEYIGDNAFGDLDTPSSP